MVMNFEKLEITLFGVEMNIKSFYYQMGVNETDFHVSFYHEGNQRG